MMYNNGDFLLFATKQKPPTPTLLQHGISYLNKNPAKKVPDAYKPLISSGYITKSGTSWKPTSKGKGVTSGNSGGGSQSTGGSSSGHSTGGGGGSHSTGGGGGGSHSTGGGGSSHSTGGSGSHSTGGGSSSHSTGGGGSSGGGISRAPSGFAGVISAKSSQVCSNVGYAGGRECTGNRASTSLFVEDDVMQNDSTKPTFKKAKAANPNGIRAGYLNLGTPNGGMKGLSTTGGFCTKYLADQKGCIDWGNPSVAAKAVAAAENIISKTKDAGGNAIRFDEMDVCEGNARCQAGLNKSLGQISQYAKQQGMALVGADSPASVQALLQAQKAGGAPVIAALVDASARDNPGNLKDMQAVVGNLPIIDDNTG